MFGPFLELWDYAKAHDPRKLRKKHFNFIHIHYIYLISLSIIMSICIYPAGGLRYIDALFFSTGACTQSGLNTVNLNDLNTYQQFIIYIFPFLATPIFINTFVVFVRLYWFEKRFKSIVKDARSLRRTRTRSRANTEIFSEKDPDVVERGVNGRQIVVLHGTKQTKPIANGGLDSKMGSLSGSREESPDSNESQDESEEDTRPKTAPHPQRNILFADEVKPGTDLNSPSERPVMDRPTIDRLPRGKSAKADLTLLRESSSPRPRQRSMSRESMPRQMDSEQHIAFLENQRNPKDKGTLRIPGPREIERGDLPQTLEDDEDNALQKQTTGSVQQTDLDDGHLKDGVEFNLDDNHDLEAAKRNITIDDSNQAKPSQHRFRKMPSPISKLALKRMITDHSKVSSAIEPVSSATGQRPRTATFGSFSRSSTSKDLGPMPYLSWQPTIGRNSAFVDLTEEQREELGGIEYRSLKTLAIVLIVYYLFWHLFGVVNYLPWIVQSKTWGPIVDNDGVNRVWWGIFTPATLFNDLGFTLTPDSFESFQTAVWPLLLGSFLIIIGNTGFPCMLRLTIWFGTKITTRDHPLWEELKFLLDHPRRCFTLLFPSSATWWLFWILFLLNVIDTVFFIILDLHDSTVTSINPPGFRVLNGIFQAASTRTAGTATVDLANLHPAIQVSYLIMMYISAFPIAISVRRTNVYEERSLGVYGSRTQEEEDDKEPSYVGAHLRRQLGFDLWFIFLGLFIIAIAEGPRLQDPNDVSFTMFAVLFEIVSAYGTVGLSLGYNNIDSSFSTEFTVVSKLVIIAMQIRGRHRGLPYGLDRAVLLPSDSLHKKEDQDALKRTIRRNSNLTALDNAGIRRANSVSLATPKPEVKGDPMDMPNPGLVQRVGSTGTVAGPRILHQQVRERKNVEKE